MDRRQLLTALAVGTAASLAAACTRGAPSALGTAAPGPVPQPVPAPGVPVLPEPPPALVEAVESATTEPAYTPSPVPTTAGPPVVLDRLPEQARLQNAIALTIDDGYSSETVAAYVQFAKDSGIHLTFSPNGVYGPLWSRYADDLRPLIEAGQVQIGNHTFSHKDLKRLTDSEIAEELEKNEEWVVKTFGTETRPWMRPPFGFRDERTDEISASLGWTNVLLWNGSFGDAAVLTQAKLMREARKWLRPGVVMLGHANHPTVTHLYPELLALLTERNLTPMTLTEAFGLAVPSPSTTTGPLSLH